MDSDCKILIDCGLRLIQIGLDESFTMDRSIPLKEKAFNFGMELLQKTFDACLATNDENLPTNMKSMYPTEDMAGGAGHSRI